MGKQRTAEGVRAAIVAALTDMSKAKAPFHAVKIIRKHGLPTRVCSALNKMGVIETGPDGSRLLVNKAAFKASADAAYREQANYMKSWQRQKRAGIKGPAKTPTEGYLDGIVETWVYDPSQKVKELVADNPRVRIKIGRLELRW